MIYKRNEIKVNNQPVSPSQLKRFMLEGGIFRIRKNAYSYNRLNDFLEVIISIYPNSIFCSYSAFYYFNMTDVIPLKYYLAISRSGTRMKNKNIIAKYYDQGVFELGKMQIDYNGHKINVYNKERLLINLIIERNKIEFDFYKQMISYYREHKNELNEFLIEAYASKMRNPKYLMDIIYREVF